MPRHPPRPADRDEVIMSVRLVSGNFEMSLRHPIFAGTTEEEFRQAIDTWLDLSMNALKLGVERLDATLDKKEPSHGSSDD